MITSPSPSATTPTTAPAGAAHSVSPAASPAPGAPAAAGGAGARTGSGVSTVVYEPPAHVRSLDIVPWPDPLVEDTGHDLRAPYVERFWLPILGPSTLWLLRRIADGLDAHPAGFLLDLEVTARQLGLVERGGRHRPFLRALGRTVQFGAARPVGERTLAVRRCLPPLNGRQLARLPEAVQRAHRAWEAGRGVEELDAPTWERACQLALTLVDLGEGEGEVKRQLLVWRFPLVAAVEAAAWASRVRSEPAAS